MYTRWWYSQLQSHRICFKSLRLVPVTSFIFFVNLTYQWHIRFKSKKFTKISNGYPHIYTSLQNDHRLFHKKHIGVKIRIFWPPIPHWESICVNLDFVFLSLVLCTCASYEFQIKCNSVSHRFYCAWCSSNSGTFPWWSGTITWSSQITPLE